MLSLTHQALEKFDNQHDFERMCADTLNNLGYKDVVPIAPKGGGDGGRDITYTTPSGEKGLACVSLRVDSDTKFNEDFGQRKKKDYSEYIFFTNQYLTSAQKLKYTKYCTDSLEARLLTQDIEYLRSLYDSALQSVRSQWLHIEVDKTPLYSVKVVNLKAYSARGLYLKANEAYENKRQFFLNKSSIAGRMPISFPGLGVQSTEDVLSELKEYATKMEELAGRASKILSFNLLLTSDKPDTNIEVQVKPADGVRLTMDNDIIEVPAKSSNDQFGMPAYSPSVSVDSRDEDEFYARESNNGGIKSNLRSVNANHSKEIFDVETFVVVSSPSDLQDVRLEVTIYSNNLGSPQAEVITLSAENATIIELKED